MALVWQCDRCGRTSDDGAPPDVPPEDWVRRSAPIRGSEGARSGMETLLCAECDDSLYEWYHVKPTAGG